MTCKKKTTHIRVFESDEKLINQIKKQLGLRSQAVTLHMILKKKLGKR